MARFEDCYCAFCKSPRRVYRKRRGSWTNIVLSFVVAGLMGWIWFQELNPKIIGLFLFNLLVSEIFVQARWRLTLACPHCGFDPVIYLSKPEKAAEKVNAFLKRQKESSSFWLKKDPLANVPKRKIEAKSSKPGHLLSRRL